MDNNKKTQKTLEQNQNNHYNNCNQNEMTMENQTIKSIENYISNELKGLNGQELLNQVSRFVNEVDEDIDALFESHFAEMAIDYYDEIMTWHEDDMYNNPEDYDTTTEEIEEYEVRWDEDGFEYHKWNQYFKELIQEAMEDAPVQTELVKHSIKHSEYSADNEIYVEVKVTYLGITDTYSKLGDDSPEPYNGNHSTDFQESDKLWEAID